MGVLVAIHYAVDYQQLKKSYCTILLHNTFFWVDICTHRKPYHVENVPCQTYFDRHIWSLLFLCIFVIFLCFFYGTQVLNVNSGCLSYISNINLSPAKKNLLIIAFIFSYSQDRVSPNNGTLLIGILIPNQLNNTLASRSLINFDFLLVHTVHFDQSIILPLLVFETLSFFFFVFVLNFRQYVNIAL